MFSLEEDSWWYYCYYCMTNATNSDKGEDQFVGAAQIQLNLLPIEFILSKFSYYQFENLFKS